MHRPILMGAALLLALATPAGADDQSMLKAHVARASAPERTLLREIVTVCRDALYSGSEIAGSGCSGRIQGWRQRFDEPKVAVFLLGLASNVSAARAAGPGVTGEFASFGKDAHKSLDTLEAAVRR